MGGKPNPGTPPDKRLKGNPKRDIKNPKPPKSIKETVDKKRNPFDPKSLRRGRR